MISIIYSFKNEESNIPELIDRTIKTCKKISEEYEVIFVDDKSTDKSKEIIKSHILKNNKIKYILMNRTFGTSPCVLAGIENSQGDYVVYLDSDLQDPPELIEEMIKKAKEGYDIIHTKRKNREGENFFKLLLTNFAYFILNKILFIKLEKNSGDFKLLSRKVANKILDMKEKDPFLRGLPSWTGYKNTIIYYDRAERFRGETKFPLLSSTNPYKEFFRAVTSFSFLPIYIILITGAISFLICLVMLLYIILINNFTNSLFLLIILFCFSTIQLSIGFLGIYIERILKNTSNRPSYIVSEKLGFNK